MCCEAWELVDDEFHLHDGKAYLAGREGVESLWCRDLFDLHVYKVDGIGFVLKKQGDPDDTAVRLQDVTNRHEIRSLAFIKKVPGGHGLHIESAMFGLTTMEDRKSVVSLA